VPEAETVDDFSWSASDEDAPNWDKWSQRSTHLELPGLVKDDDDDGAEEALHWAS
jgi:hypothetical protein